MAYRVYKESEQKMFKGSSVRKGEFMEYVQMTLDDYIQCKNEIKENIGGIVKSFVRIGWQLTRINNSRAYELDGYKSIAEFARAEYDMSPSGVSRFMNVYEKYSVEGDTPELQERYKDFKFAQLTEMLQLTQEDREMILPEAKREDIRELQRFNKENENNPENLMNWKEEPKEDRVTETIREFFHEKKEILNTLYGSEAYQTGNIKEMIEIINPSGNLSYRKGTIFLMMYSQEKGIKIKEFGRQPRDMVWEEFFAITQNIFADAAAGERTWENYFGEVRTPEVKGEPKIAPAQNEEPKQPEVKTEEKPTPEPEPKREEPGQKESDQEEQVPGQDHIENHPEYMPVSQTEKEPEKERQPKESSAAEPETNHAESPEKKRMTRKEYLDSLTSYGAAEYMAKAMLSLRNKTFNTLLETEFWENWFDKKVDCNGRIWID